MARRFGDWGSWLALAALGSGCAGGQSGDLDGRNGDSGKRFGDQRSGESGSYFGDLDCSLESEPIAEEDIATQLGLDAASIMAWAGEPFSARAVRATGPVTEPVTEEVDLLLELERSEEPARVEGWSCNGVRTDQSLVVPVRAHFDVGGGELAGTIPALLRPDGALALLTSVASVEEVTGDFARARDGSALAGGVSLNASLVPDHMRGRLTWPNNSLEWPPITSCPAPAVEIPLEPSDRAWAEAPLASLGSATWTGTWTGGASTEVQVVVELEGGRCADGRAETIPARVRLTSADGRADLELPGSLEEPCDAVELPATDESGIPLPMAVLPVCGPDAIGFRYSFYGGPGEFLDEHPDLGLELDGYDYATMTLELTLGEGSGRGRWAVVANGRFDCMPYCEQGVCQEICRERYETLRELIFTYGIDVEE